MSKTKKIILASATVAFLFLVGYFFMQKTTTKCGDINVYPYCMTCICSMGLPYDPTPFGGQLKPKCLMGKLLECKTTNYSE